MRPKLHVAAAVLMDQARRVLVQRRAPDTHQGGLWEFPGGKLETGESVFDALRRELAEELGIAVQEASPLIRVEHPYPDRTVVLDVWRVIRFSGAIEPRERQPLLWANLQTLPDLSMPPADRPVIDAILGRVHRSASPVAP